MRKSILYVDAEPVENRDISVRGKREKYILRRLRENYEASLVYDLFSERVNSILKLDFDLMMTHFPFKIDKVRGRFDYGDAIGKVRQVMVVKPGMKIVAYTGAYPRDLSDDMLKGMGVEGVVRKHLDDVASDYEEIKKVLGMVLGDG